MSRFKKMQWFTPVRLIIVLIVLVVVIGALFELLSPPRPRPTPVQIVIASDAALAALAQDGVTGTKMDLTFGKHLHVDNGESLLSVRFTNATSRWTFIVDVATSRVVAQARTAYAQGTTPERKASYCEYLGTCDS